MYKLISLFLITIIVNVSISDDVISGTELVLSFMVHRHGDRTPVQSTLSYSTDPEALELLSQKYGYGQLTDVGKRTGYKVGQFIRSRYDELLSAEYNRSEIYIRSTDSTRTKMTALAAMAAVYPATTDNWSADVNWQPIPYTTVPAKYDYNLAILNCPNFIDFYYNKFTSSSTKMAAYTGVLDEWSRVLGFNITQLPVLAYAIYDVYTSQVSLGLPLGPEIEDMFSQIEAAAGGAIDVVFGDEDYVALQAGVLLNQFFKGASLAISGNDTQRVHVYSAHDYNVYSFMAVARIAPRQGVPKYGSAFALELRRVSDTGKYVVLPVYVKSPGDSEVLYLNVEGCEELLCDLDEFRDVTAQYVMDEDSWRAECGFTDDFVVDDSSIA